MDEPHLPHAQLSDNKDEFWMRQALALAAEAGRIGEVPIGALIVCQGQLVAQAANVKEANGDPLGHAEVLVIRLAAEKLGRWRLSDCTLYVTLEPCTMCAGAIVQSRVDRVVYAARDPKAGAVQSLYKILADYRLNHSPEVVSGVLEAEASQQLRDFFRALRSRPPESRPKSKTLPPADSKISCAHCHSPTPNDLSYVTDAHLTGETPEQT